MKKNIMMRLSALLLVAVLLTTCVISGTFAKYTTTDSATDTAKVAAWGIQLTVDGDAVLYDDDKTNPELTTLVHATDLAAPGTYQKLATVNLTGTPEVAYKIVVDVDLELANWTVDGNVYCPLVFTVDGDTYKIDATNTDTAKLAAAIEKAVLKAIAGGDASSAVANEAGTGLKYEVKYNAGTAVATGAADANGVVVDWLWAFNGEDPEDDEDAKDTKLGNATTKAKIDFTLTVTVEQVEKVA